MFSVHQINKKLASNSSFTYITDWIQQLTSSQIQPKQKWMKFVLNIKMPKRLCVDSQPKEVNQKIGCINLSPFAEINQLINPKFNTTIQWAANLSKTATTWIPNPRFPVIPNRKLNWATSSFVKNRIFTPRIFIHSFFFL